VLCLLAASCYSDNCTVHNLLIKSGSDLINESNNNPILGLLGCTEHIFVVWEFFIQSFIPLACVECDDSLPFSGASFILCYIPFHSTLFHQLVFHPPSLHLTIYFLVYLSALLFPNSYIILFWKFYSNLMLTAVSCILYCLLHFDLMLTAVLYLISLCFWLFITF